jgi:hypothetical protein
MTPPFMPMEFTRDPRNPHYDTRRTWLAWRDPEPERAPARQRLGRMIVRFGQWLAGRPLEPAASLDAARA